MSKKCNVCGKEEVQNWIPEWNICNRCLAKGFWPVPDEPKKGEET